MVAVAYPPTATPWRERLGPRAIILIVILLIHIVLLLLVLFARREAPPREPPPTVVRLIALPKSAPPAAAKPTPKPVTRPHKEAVKAPVPIVKVPPQKDTPPALFKTEMMEAVDIAKLPSHHDAQVADNAGTGTTVGPPAAASGEGDYGPSVGNGPHGEKVFAAEWYREPTHAEIAPYLPKHLPDVSTADIMCRTIERYGVEDCLEAGEQPPGTGLSRAIRQAGWQFKVKPVRLGQKFQVGTWVRIRFTITAVPRGDDGG